MKDKSGDTGKDAGALAAHYFREHSGRMVAAMAHRFGMDQIDNILDAVQDAFESALQNWRFSGMPDHPSAWLMKVARNKLLNILKRDGRMTAFDPEAETPAGEAFADPSVEDLPGEKEIADSQLYLLLACCHPGLSEKSRIMITLHVLCGFGVPEIAGALQMSHEAVKKSLARGKAILRNSGTVFRKVVNEELAAQAGTVHTILYLMFNEGYKTTRDDQGINKDLCYEAIRLAQILLKESPPDQDTCSLLALMFLTAARFPARLPQPGGWLTMEEQDRALWDKRLIAEGINYLNRAAGDGLTPGRQKTFPPENAGKYYLEALIASLHCMAPEFSQTNWKRITELYKLLESIEPGSPPVRLNRLIAESYLKGPLAVLPELESLENEFRAENKFLIAVTRGNLYDRAGAHNKAHQAYTEALALTQSELDKKFLQRKMVSGSASPDDRHHHNL